MRRSRILLLVTAASALGVVALGLALYGVARLSWFERHASEWLSATLGLPVQVGGIRIGYFPLPWVELEAVEVAGSETAGAGSLLEVAGARLVLPWRTVMDRRLRIARVELKSPAAHLAVDAAGRDNWSRLLERLEVLIGEEPAAWSIGTLAIEGGGIDYFDAGSGTAFEVTGLALTGSDMAPGEFFPMQLRLAGQAGDHTFHATSQGETMLDLDRNAYGAEGLALRGWVGGGDLGLGGVELAADIDALRADLAAGDIVLNGVKFDGLGVTLEAEAQVSQLNAQPVANFSITTEPFAPRTIGYALNRPLPETRDPQALARAQLALQGTWRAGELSLENLRAELDDSTITGSLRLPAAPQPPHVRLDVDRIDLDRYLPPVSADKNKADTKATPETTLESLLATLVEIDVDAVVTVATARAVGATARDLRIVIEPNEPDPAVPAP